MKLDTKNVKFVDGCTLGSRCNNHVILDSVHNLDLRMHSTGTEKDRGPEADYIRCSETQSQCINVALELIDIHN